MPVHEPDDAFCPFFHRPCRWPHSHHVHVVEAGGAEERRTLAFRDYLGDHPAAAAEYEDLKRTLVRQLVATTHESRETYACAKTEFIARIVTMALGSGYPRESLQGAQLRGSFGVAHADASQATGRGLGIPREGVPLGTPLTRVKGALLRLEQQSRVEPAFGRYDEGRYKEQRLRIADQLDQRTE